MIKFTSQQNITHQNLNIYGLHDIGKTRLALTADKPLVLSVEGGTKSLMNADIPYIECFDKDRFDQALLWIKKPENWNNFETLFLDSGSELSDKAAIDFGGSKSKSGSQAHGQQVYGKMLNYILDTLDELQHMEKTVVALWRMDQVNMSSIPEITDMKFAPMASGQKLDKRIPYLWDSCFWMTENENKEKYFLTNTENNKNHVARCRLGHKLEEWEPANINHIINKLKS